MNSPLVGVIFNYKSNNMKSKPFHFNSLGMVVAVFCPVLFSCDSKPNYQEAEQYIKQSEKDWAESAASGDSTVIVRILADDFVGVDPDGNHYHKQQMIKDTYDGPNYFLSNHLNNVKVRFYGNTAVAQGDETWVKRKDSLTARFVWTDTWVLRNNKWQIVAAEDLIAPVEDLIAPVK
jgi:ketosteroid isomerase-like protein